MNCRAAFGGFGRDAVGFGGTDSGSPFVDKVLFVESDDCGDRGIGCSCWGFVYSSIVAVNSFEFWEVVLDECFGHGL